MANVIIKGATPDVVLELDADITEFEVINVAVSSRGCIFSIPQERLTVAETENGGCSISFDFTQEETLKLEGSMSIQIRARRLRADSLSETVASEIVTAPVTDVLLKQVI